MSEKVPCEYCGVPIAPAGRKMHEMLKHPELAGSTKEKSGGPTMAEVNQTGHTGGGFCPECNKKDWALHKLEEEKAKLAEDLAKEKAAHAAATSELPSLGAVIAHCEGGNCKAHSAELKTFKDKVVEEARTEAMKDKNFIIGGMKAHHLDKISVPAGMIQ